MENTKRSELRAIYDEFVLIVEAQELLSKRVCALEERCDAAHVESIGRGVRGYIRDAARNATEYLEWLRAVVALAEQAAE